METLGDRVARKRDEKHWSQGQLAAEVRRINPTLKTRQSTIGAIERNESKKPTILYELAKALGVSEKWLKTGRGPETQHQEPEINLAELLDHIFATVEGTYIELGFDPEAAAELAETVRELALEPLSASSNRDFELARRVLGESAARKFLKSKPILHRRS